MLPKRSLTWLRGASARAGTSPASLLAALVAAVLLMFVGVPLVVVREDTVQPRCPKLPLPRTGTKLLFIMFKHDASSSDSRTMRWGRHVRDKSPAAG